MNDNDKASGLTRDTALSEVPPPDPSQCGDPGDDDRIWKAVKNCVKQGTCDQKGPNSVVLDGTEYHRPNYITVPTVRVNGIECPWIAQPDRPNYWYEAWEWANQSPTKVTDEKDLALGVNSKERRTKGADQLHIHMAKVRDYSLSDLVIQDNSIARKFEDWDRSRVKITGWNAERGYRSEHVYRAVMTDDLKGPNVFYELRKIVGEAHMHAQTLIVMKRPKGGWYIVNSNLDLKSPAFPNVPGSDTCDPLLLLQKG